MKNTNKCKNSRPTHKFNSYQTPKSLRVYHSTIKYKSKLASIVDGTGQSQHSSKTDQRFAFSCKKLRNFPLSSDHET